MIQVGLMRHYDPQHVAVREAVESGAIGQPLLLRGWHRNPPDVTPPSSSDILIQAAVHDLYSARWLLGQEVSEVHVRGVMIEPDRSDQLDLQLITMSMSDGALAVLEVNKNARSGYEVGVEITGSAGIVSTAPHHTPVVRSEGELRQRVEPDWLERFGTAYRLEAEAWVLAAASGTATGPDAADGCVTLAAALAAVESLRSGRPVPISLPELPPAPSG
jgi:myo-inositol 2-dehydrogenase/D-chiro-inositol 1-dehydrogenase